MAKKFNKKRTKRIIVKEGVVGPYRYKMPKEMADAILKTRRKNEDVQSYLCETVNSEFGLSGTCVEVVIG